MTEGNDPQACAGAPTDERREAKACAKCGRMARIVAHGLCRKCYDHDRFCGDPLARIAHVDRLSDHARLVMRAAVEFRRSTGREPCISDLVDRLKGKSRGEVVAGSIEAIRAGSACYSFRPIMLERPRSKRNTRTTEDVAAQKPAQIVQETEQKHEDSDRVSDDVVKGGPYGP